MAVLKLFECLKYRPEFDCAYTIAGPEDYVIDQAANHEYQEHGIEDTPANRQKIQESLIDDGGDPPTTTEEG